jgi:hypothetical protein
MLVGNIRFLHAEQLNKRIIKEYKKGPKAMP